MEIVNFKPMDWLGNNREELGWAAQYLPCPYEVRLVMTVVYAITL